MTSQLQRVHFSSLLLTTPERLETQCLAENLPKIMTKGNNKHLRKCSLRLGSIPHWPCLLLSGIFWICSVDQVPLDPAGGSHLTSRG